MKLATRYVISSITLLAICHFDRGAVADGADSPPASRPAAGEQLETKHFLLRPAEPPYAALRYQLLPSMIDQTPGNAAPQYVRAIMAWSNDKAYEDAIPKLPDWIELPLDQLKKNEEAQNFFNSTPTDKWELIHFAARKEYCDWDLPLREFVFSTHIPELQKMRDLARLVAFKARIEMSRGEFDNAVDTIQTGIVMARQVAQGRTLVSSLVAVAIAKLMFTQIEELIQQPRSPNLYWSLSVLPEPFIDMRPGLEFEQDALFLFIPELRDIRHASHTEAVWNTMLLQVADRVIKVMDETSGNKKNLGWLGNGALFAITAYPKAKKQLQDAGYTSSQINAMPASQAILTATVESFEHSRDEVYMWLYVPAPEAFAGLAEATKHLHAQDEVIPVAALLLPSLVKVKDAEVRSRRDLAALRLLEALRLYAVHHGNQLPQRLSDMEGVPLPNDPMTGQPFAYQFSGGEAVVTSPAPPSEPASQGLSWTIQMATKK